MSGSPVDGFIRTDANPPADAALTAKSVQMSLVATKGLEHSKEPADRPSPASYVSVQAVYGVMHRTDSGGLPDWKLWSRGNQLEIFGHLVGEPVNARAGYCRALMLLTMKRKCFL